MYKLEVTCYPLNASPNDFKANKESELTEQDVEEYLKAGNALIFTYEDGSGLDALICGEFFTCRGKGNTPQEAVKKAQENLASFEQSLVDKHGSIPNYFEYVRKKLCSYRIDKCKHLVGCVMTPLPITVIIPCYNMAEQLEVAVSSAVLCNPQHIIVVNDGSDDNTHVVAQKLQAQFGIGYIRSSMRNGVCFARNAGIAQAADDTLIVPLDADDFIPADGSNGLGRLHAAYKPRTWVYGDWIEYSNDTTQSEVMTAPPAGMLDRKNICHATMLFAKEDWARVGGYDPDFNIGGEDWAFQRALTQADVTPVKAEGITYCRVLADNVRTAKARERIPLINQLMREKYGG